MSDHHKGCFPARSSITVIFINRSFRLLVMALLMIAAGLTDQVVAKNSLADNPVPVVTVAAASYESTAVTPEAIVSAFGTGLATSVAVGDDADPGAVGVQLPTSLAGTTVEVGGRLAGLFFVSPNQINYVIPPATPAGAVTVIVRSGDGTVSTGTVQVRAVAPSIFTANADGGGVPAANLVRVRADGQQIFESLADFDSASNRFVTRAIDLGPEGETVVLVLYASGVHNAPDPNGDGNANENVRVTIGGSETAPLFVGRQPSFLGLDQINVIIPRSQIGRGKVSLSITGSGIPSSNVVQIELAGMQGAAPPVVDGFGASSALAGQTLNINGSGFATNLTDNLVRIGGVEARMVSASSTLLSVIVPFGAETGAATVRTPQGEGKSNSSLPVRTSISGFVENTGRQPMSGATVRVSGTNITATSGADGLFLLPDVPAGAALVEVDGTSVVASPPFPKVTLKMIVNGNRDNQFSRPVALQQATGATISIGTGSEPASLTEAVEAVDGTIQSGNVTLDIPANTAATFPNGAKSGTLTLTVVAGSRTPVNFPPGHFSSVIAQISPFGVKLNPGGKLTFPNPDGLPAGSTATLFRYDPNAGGFVDGGAATVSGDGQRIETAANAITETSYFFISVSRPTTTVIGRVVDSDSTTPVRDALVRSQGQESFTDGNGGFIMRNVQVGSGGQIMVEASIARASGRIDRTQRTGIPVVAGGTTNVTPDLVLPSEAVNRPPVILAPSSTTLNVNQTRNISFTASDPDQGQTIRVTVSGAPFASVSSNGNGSYNLSLTPGAGQGGGYTLTLTATDDLGASTTQNVSVTVTTNPDLKISMTDSPDPLTIGTGQNVTYSILVNNSGAVAATGVTVTDTLPAGVTLVSANASVGSCTNANGVVTCNIGNLAVNDSAGVTIVAAPTGPGTLNNTASVSSAGTDFNPVNNTATSVTTVNAPNSDLFLTMSSSPNPVTLGTGQNITYSLNVYNYGPTATATGVVVTDTLPAGVTFVSATASAGSCTFAGGTVTCNIGNLTSSAGVSIVVTPTTAGAVNNTATVSGTLPDNNAANDTATVSNTVNAANADVYLTMSSSPASTTLGTGQNINYSMTVYNNGPTSTATGVVVTDTLPAGVTFVSATASAGSCSFAGGTVTCNIGNLTSSAGVSIIVTPTATGTVSNTVSVSGTLPDNNAANDTATVSNTVNAANADVYLTMSSSPASTTLGTGQNINYSMTVYNNGPTSTATGVVVTDTLPAGVTFVSATASAGSCSFAGGTVTCNIGNLTSSAGVSIIVTPTTAGVLNNTASVSGTLPDSNAANDTVTVSNTVAAANADVSVSISDSPDPLVLGSGNLTYSIAVTNNGPTVTATGVVVTDTLPTSMTFVSAGSTLGSCSFSGGTVTCNVGALSGTAYITIVVTPTTGGDFSNTVSVSGTLPDNNPANNSATAVTSINSPVSDPGSADLNLVMSGTPQVTLGSGSNVNYSITVYNNGPASPATGVVVTDTLPAGLTFISASTNVGSCSFAGGTVTCNIGNVTTSASITIVASPNSAGPMVNTATVTSALNDLVASNNSATVATNVSASSADLYLTMSGTGSATLGAGQNITYTMGVYNSGPAATATGVVVTDTLPAGVTFVSANASQGTCTQSGGVVTCNLGSLGYSASVTIVVAPTAPGVMMNTASVSGTLPDPIPSNNAASASTNVIASNTDLSLSMTATGKTILGSGSPNITYTLSVYNNGPAATATGVVVSDMLPAGVTFVSANASQGTCTQSGGVVTCNLGSLGYSASVTIVVTPTTPGVVTNSASVSGTLPDSVPSNNAASASTSVVASNTDLSLLMSATDRTTLGLNSQNITYTLSVYNNGPAATATGVVVTDTLPAGVTFVSANASQGTCSFSGGTVTCNLGSLGYSASVSIVVTPTAAGVITNTASVNGTLPDSVPSNNAASASTSVYSISSDLSLSMSATDQVTLGTNQNITYTVGIINNGPASTATGVVFTDTLPAGVSFVSANTTQGTCSFSGGTVTCNIGNMSGGAGITITVAPTFTGAISNTASVTGTLPDPVAGNNSATASTNILPPLTPPAESDSASPAGQGEQVRSGNRGTGARQRR